MSFILDNSFAVLAANLATILMGLFIGVQLLLAMGILPVTMAWGGRQKELTPNLRMASMAAIIVLAVFIYILRYRAGLVGRLPTPTPICMLAWVVTGFMALNTLGNFASLSRIERWLFGPLSLIITLASIIVAVS